MEQNIIKKILVGSMFITLFILSFLILKPFITSILSAIVLTYLFYPLYKKSNNKFKKPNLIAFLICIGIAVIILVLLIFLANFALKEIIDFYAYAETHDITAPLKSFFMAISPSEGSTYQLAAFFDIAVNKGQLFLFDTISKTIINIPYIILQIFVALFVMFYLLKEGHNLFGYLQNLLPFRKKIRKKFFIRFQKLTKGFLYSIVIVGLIQGIFAGIGFYIFGASQPFILTALATLAAIFPLIGAWLIWVPVVIGMLIKGSTLAGIGLLLYGLIIVGNVDNLIRPKIIGKITKMPESVVLLGMLGGLHLFGLIGLIIGPLILDYMMIFIEFYRTKQIKKLI